MSVTFTQDDQGVRFDGAFAWANNAAINTVVTLAVAIAASARKSKKYFVVIYNPGAVGLTVNIQAGENLAGADRFNNTATAITVAAGTTYVGVLPDLFPGAVARIQAQNTTAVGAAGAFTATMRVRELA